MIDSIPSIICPKCLMISYNPNDISNKYCGNCKKFHEQLYRELGIKLEELYHKSLSCYGTHWIHFASHIDDVLRNFREAK